VTVVRVGVKHPRGALGHPSLQGKLRVVIAMEGKTEGASHGGSTGLADVDVAYALGGGDGRFDFTKGVGLFGPVGEGGVDPYLFVGGIYFGVGELICFYFEFVVVVFLVVLIVVVVVVGESKAYDSLVRGANIVTIAD